MTKHKVAAHLEKVVDKEYSFHELYLKFATEKQQGGRNIKTCITKSAGDRYMAHFELYIQPNFEDCPVHTIGGAKLQVFIDKLLDKGNKPELYKTANLVLANLRRFFTDGVQQINIMKTFNQLWHIEYLSSLNQEIESLEIK